MLAVVFVGNSKRFPNKHFVEVKPGFRLIDLILDSLRSAGLDILVFSKVNFNCSFPILEDKKEWIIPSFIYLFEELSKMGIREFLAVAGDMPLISRESVNFLLGSSSEDFFALVPRWHNGWVEPLFALYRIEFLELLKESFRSGIRSLQAVIRRSHFVKFINAEDFPPYTFLNVNYVEDLYRLKEVISYFAFLREGDVSSQVL
ncbi:MAG: molybdenum cofactor guanylyltransferase [Synergistetes bacterium]|nr:molybdenum cofactor guanylyltransferase [Synergistota bacterium]MCX8127478.1 molybdenum cofactor guanylyltransferase [Synergistota bacterium]MDW8192745.1 molybdenum cofactor guanylyltransferase [Synergistota bacterium]